MEQQLKQQLKNILELSRDPMLAVERGKILYANSAARGTFSAAQEGKFVSLFLPRQILHNPAGRFAASASVEGRSCAVTAAEFGTLRVFTLRIQEGNAAKELVSSGMLVNLQSTLFNFGLAADRLSLVLEESRNVETQRMLTVLRHSYYSLRRQLGNLYYAVQMRSSAMMLNPRCVDLTELCGNLAETVAAMVGDKRPPLRFVTEEPYLPANVDSRKLERILLNLLSNSYAHTPPDGSIQLRLSKNGENAVMAIKDTGNGISEDIMRNIFSRFENGMESFPLDREATAGLGLTVASGLAQLHGGVLMIESREGEGTSAYAVIPLGSTAAAEAGDYIRVDGMQEILTELSGILDRECYAPEYLD